MLRSESLTDRDFDFERFFSKLEITLTDTHELLGQIEAMSDDEDPPTQTRFYKKGQPSNKVWLNQEGLLHRLDGLPAEIQYGFKDNIVSCGFHREGHYCRDDGRPTEVWFHRNRSVALLQWHNDKNELHNMCEPAEVSLNDLQELEYVLFCHNGQPVSINKMPPKIHFISTN